MLDYFSFGNFIHHRGSLVKLHCCFSLQWLIYRRKKKSNLFIKKRLFFITPRASILWLFPIAIETARNPPKIPELVPEAWKMALEFKIGNGTTGYTNPGIRHRAFFRQKIFSPEQFAICQLDVTPCCTVQGGKEREKKLLLEKE